MEEGMVVIVSTGQAGTIMQSSAGQLWVLLRNYDVWTGDSNRVRLPQDQADLDACPVDVERLESKRIDNT